MLRPVCSLIGVSVIGLFLAQATLDALILGICPFGAALGRVRVQDIISSGFKNDHTGKVKDACRIKYQLEGDIKVNVPYVSSSCCFAHVRQHEYWTIGENVHVCPNCQQHCTASAIQTTEAFAERRLERTAVENKQCRELPRPPRLSQACN